MARAKRNPKPAAEELPVEELAIEETPHAIIEIAAPKAPKVKTKKTGVGAFVIAILKANLENKVAMTHAQILEKVKDHFGDEVKTTKACIAWYASKVKGEYI